MQHVLQAGLSAGMSATDGIHKAELIPVDPSYHGTQVLSQGFVPNKTTCVTLRGRQGNISAPKMNIGAWSLGWPSYLALVA